MKLFSRKLQLHKLFIDAERKEFEKQDREISSGQLLNLLVNDVNFQWLRKFLIFIVEIDEMFDLNDEYLQNMVEKHHSQIQNLITPDLADEMYEGKYKAFMQDNIENSTKHNELKKLIIAVQDKRGSFTFVLPER